MERNMDFNNFGGFPPPYMNFEQNSDFPRNGKYYV